MVFAAIAMLIGGIAVCWVAYLGGRGRLPLQHWAGIRTGTTMTDEQTWSAAHRAAAPWVMLAGVAMALGGLLVIVLSPTEDTGGVILLVSVAIAGVPLIAGGFRGQQAARNVLSTRS